MINNRNDISEFEELLMNSDVRYYLKASPFEAGERSRLDNALTEDYYWISGIVSSTLMTIGNLTKG